MSARAQRITPRTFLIDAVAQKVAERYYNKREKEVHEDLPLLVDEACIGNPLAGQYRDQLYATKKAWPMFEGEVLSLAQKKIRSGRLPHLER